jgi:hypothetical protein
MDLSRLAKRVPVRWLVLALAVVAGSTALALAQQAGGERGDPAARVRLEYLSQEVLADDVVQTLNDLDSQGWDLVQLVPIWTFRNEAGENGLVARSYQVFARRPVK